MFPKTTELSYIKEFFDKAEEEKRDHLFLLQKIDFQSIVALDGFRSHFQ